MDSDIKYIIDEEEKLNRQLEEAVAAARRMVDEHSRRAHADKKTELESIESRYRELTQKKLEEIRKETEGRLQALAAEQERLLASTALVDRITERIISLILEERP